MPGGALRPAKDKLLQDERPQSRKLYPRQFVDHVDHDALLGSIFLSPAFMMGGPGLSIRPLRRRDWAI